MKLHELLDWHSIAGHLKGLYQREKSGAGGPEPYNRLGMFKLMLLGQWHGLSDAQLEQALHVRLDFMVFTGLEPSAGALPDASTICRFRNRLVTAGLDQKLLMLVNGQLEQLGLKVRGARGATRCIPLYKQFNQKIGAIRFKVEQAFGTMKHRFNLARARCF